ncbi:MAG: ABC transporter substrate-binding protein [Chloroflexi bacterium]|nr:ABC transporter substrate-binding protein [Chloroflexota bacterium]
MKFTGSRTKLAMSSVVILLIASAFGCSTASAPPSTAPSEAPKAQSQKESQPAASQAKPAAKEAKPETKPAPSKEVAKPEKLVKMKAAYSAVSGSQTPMWVAKEKKLFEKYGLDLDLQYIASSTTVAPAMLSGEVHVAASAAGSVVSAGLGGGDLIIVATTDEVLPFSLYVVPSIKRIEDLKGQKVGVTRFGSATDFAARQTLKKLNLEPDKDVAVVQMGGVPQLRAGLESGAIQGSVFGPPDSLLARKVGMVELVSYSKLNNLYPTGSIAVSRKYLDGNRDTMRNFMKAFVEGIAISKNDKDYAMKVISQYSKIEDKEVLEETHAIYVAQLMPKVPYASIEGIQVVLDDMAKQNPKAKDSKPETFVDNSLVKELDDSGFIKKLYP